jgi:cytochrome c biogenesis protein
MSSTTPPAETPDRTGRLHGALELLASMRFAIALLTIICVASVIGTVVKQHEPYPNYVNQFGPFWAQVFDSLKLYSVYSAWWFLLILAFLVISTSLCIARNTPKILSDLKQYKENIREQALQAFHHKAQGQWDEAPAQAAQRVGQLLATGGWKVRLQSRQTSQGEGWMIAAKAGAANKLGYIAAHSAIVLICIGGLLDGDLFVRAQTWMGGKSVYTGGGLISQVPEQHRLSERNPAFRGNLMVAEGTASSTAILSQSDGVLLQELPFAVELKKFIVEYYSTGMPKLFASDIVIYDKATGEKKEARVEVNHPASFKGVEIYQSSFDDGGSEVTLGAVPMGQASKPFEVKGTIGSSTELTNVRAVNLRSSIEARLGSADKTVTQRDLRNVGPSVSYKLRDAAGQAREYNNYMLPVDTGDGVRVFLLGMRESPSEPYRYLRLPVDENDSLEGFVRLRDALGNPGMRALAIDRYAAKAVDPKRPELRGQLAQSAQRALGLYAGQEEVAGKKVWGLQALADFLDVNVPEAERGRAGEMFVRILNGVLYELDALARERAGVKPLPESAVQAFMTQSVISLGDAPLYPAPMALMLKDFKQVQASVFQVARAPGKTVVYLGCALLILGVFAMLYIRERRLWIWLTPDGHGLQARMAMSVNRRTLDADQEFEQLQKRLLKQEEPSA